jgi:nicotinate-nucleotide--dimethylbenzimidazole phosphoribosyltransferase
MLTAKPFPDLIQLIQKIGNDANAVPEVENPSEDGGFDKEIGKGGAGLNALKTIAMTQGVCEPKLSQAHICIFASTYAEIDAIDEVMNFVASAKAGNAAVNKLCVPNGLGLRVFELAPQKPHTSEPVWSEMECMHAVAFGMEAVAAGGHLLGLAAHAPGPKAHVLKLLEGLTSINDPMEALELFRHCAGREMAAMMGAIIAAKSQKIPLVIEGNAAIAAVAVLERIFPKFCDHVIFSCLPLYDNAAEIVSSQKNVVLASSSGLGAGSDCALAMDVIFNIHKS